MFEGIPLSFGFFVFRFVISTKMGMIKQALGKSKDVLQKIMSRGVPLLQPLNFGM